MKIAIIGAGFSGLATAWTLLQHKTKYSELDVTLFDSRDIGKGTSGISAGLLHPFVGLHAKLNQNGFEGFASTLKLLKASEEALGYSPYDQSGILRTALTNQQIEEYQLCSEKYPQETAWMKVNEVEHLVPGIKDTPGLLIKKGIVVYSEGYLEGLYLSFLKNGGIFKKEKIKSLESLNQFDRVIVAMGADCNTLKELSHLHFPLTKGQILELLWPETLPPLPLAINSQLYCVMLQDKKRCLVGSTYERHFESKEPDFEVAKREILPRLKLLYPPLEGAEILGCRAGIRASGPQHMPVLQELSERHFLLTAMGSKGLLYHALYAEKLAGLLFEQK